MPNTFLTPSVIARAALATLYENAVFAGLVYRDYDGDFAGKQGDTVTIRKPAVFTANVFNRATGIVLQDAAEAGLPVTLDTLLDVSIPVTDEEMTLEISDFALQILNPAMEAINQAVDRRIADALTGVGVASTAAVPGGTGMVDAGKILNDFKVPMADRHAVLATNLGAALLKDPLFHSAEKRGDTDGLRNASIGRAFGFDTYIDQNVPGTVGTPVIKGASFHRTAAALVSRTLAVPQGGVQASAQNYKGLGVRVIYGYDQAKKQQVLSIDCLIGVKLIDANRAVKLT